MRLIISRGPNLSEEEEEDGGIGDFRRSKHEVRLANHMI